MPSPTAAVISATGISAPSYAEILEYLKASYRSIYGADTYLEPDSQDGQFLAVIALALSDANAAAIAAYLSFSPNTAQGAGLSSNIKLNGIRRGKPTNSQADLTIIGQAGTSISNGLAQDDQGLKWALPSVVVIPTPGTITVTATCTTVGATPAGAGKINQIATPIRGWQSVTNATAASPGSAIEEDATVRRRQKNSVALPSRTVLNGTVGVVADLPGVTQCVPNENDTDATDAKGIPPHHIALVVAGGDVQAIAQAIALKKTPGTGTFGNTSASVIDQYGRPVTIRFFRPTPVPITVAISVRALAGYTSTIETAIQNDVSDYVNSVELGGGESGAVEWGDAITVANSVEGRDTFKISSFTLSGPGGLGAPDVPLLFNEEASCTPSSVVITVI
ncbi:baseplate J/gp47 family protein [Pseudomonas sp. NPDC098747]|uniref:baseplate J/gp47 family protein n=1 Tax=Pseudomonas sp. NPDC098747 TaxID=3364487 RepID=UPI00383B39E8